ncbi:hypothetical protein OO25_19090 [Phaeobacter sp. S60]|nr:hypothetical protein OO25_19090 [Phaeobacter sp. S60]
MTPFFVIAAIWVALDAVWLFDKTGWKKTAPSAMTGSQHSHLIRLRWEYALLFLTVSIWSAFNG